MSRARAIRAARIVQLRSIVVDRIEVELGSFARRTAALVESVRLAREAWQTAATQPAVSICSSTDMVQAHDYRLGLVRRIDTLAGEERKARIEEEACRKRLCAAKADMKKIEMWRDGLLEAAGAEEMMHERKATDEVAARIARTA
jgi:flagellar export protein FliJ